MKQEHFERVGQERWREFEGLLRHLEARRNHSGSKELPARYRRICQDLALARDRQFSRHLIERLEDMALRGHQQLYRPRRISTQRALAFLHTEFPAVVRAEWRLVLLLSALFYGAGVGLAWGIQLFPELAYSFAEPAQLTVLEHMYDPQSDDYGVDPQAGMGAARFGFYIFNNISIAFRTFACGIAFGVGSLLIIGFNGIFLGVVFGHLIQKQLGEPLLTFVIAHGAFELTAIVLAGVAGMRLGLGLIAPGPHSRLQSLRNAAQRALPIVYGCAVMLVIAAGIEAYWSPLKLEPVLKYAVGGILWLLVAAYFCFAGRARAV